MSGPRRGRSRTTLADLNGQMAEVGEGGRGRCRGLRCGAGIHEYAASSGASVVRATPKAHGASGHIIEAIEKPDGVRCVVVDDAGTTGASIVQAPQIVRPHGMRAMGACCIVDR